MKLIIVALDGATWMARGYLEQDLHLSLEKASGPYQLRDITEANIGRQAALPSSFAKFLAGASA